MATQLVQNGIDFDLKSDGCRTTTVMSRGRDPPGPLSLTPLASIGCDRLAWLYTAIDSPRATKHRAPSFHDVKRDNMQFTSLAAVQFSYISAAS